MSLFDQLPHTTSRIETITTNGSSVGTGFFFNIEVPGKGTMTLLVTNKHVLEGAISATVYMSRAGENGPIPGIFNSWNIPDILSVVVWHPDPNVDLAAFPVGGILNAMDMAGTPPYFRAFDVSTIPTQAQIEELTAIEDIVMIGYPTGLWDQSNNFPIVRRGVTATPYALNYNGRAEFMIDCACFPGSSGSPVLIANHGSFPAKNGDINFGTRMFLLGLLWGGPQYTTQGKIIAQPVPTSLVPVAVSQIPTNLGFCVKSRMITDLIPLLLGRFG
ncbi:S1 family peptidase [Agrobacterium tumefaciens]|uniref:S1 family peptidase n=1 Tax=Agrobacterium tumefaciens TaxID=358 RepID=UPI001574E6F0|nr:serine protease [Agrobacterium tumefaciens]NSX90127.1 trypsin-like peptidase domain-containing protein [Agrobacterium tumefaciens]